MEEQIAIFCDTDDFCKAYEEYFRNKLLMNKKEVIPQTRMSLSEIMTILIICINCRDTGHLNSIIQSI